MKLFLVIAILFTAILSAKDRPKIALVLSGGGARGGAHVGVLRILEEKNIPIDLIVGTSMGSFVGGLYASGKTVDEIDEMLTTTNWEDFIRSEFIREDTPIRVKQYDYTYNGRMRIGLNSKNEISLPTGMLNRQPLLFKMLSQTQDIEHVTNFDNFPIPFRAVATDIGNGNEVVISSGSLSKAIYASSAIPGGLQPIVIDSKTLIDGGVSDNMPILLAKKMGADIIIAVDVSEHFDKNLNVNSYFGVLGQLVNILMRKNADFSISLLHDEDILITPDLDGFTGLDADKYMPIIKRGEDATTELYETKLKSLSISDEEYAEYKLKHRTKPSVSYRKIDKIVIDNETFIGDDSIMQRLNFKVGDEIDEDKIRTNLIHLYNMTIFDTIDYNIKTVNGVNTITIIAKPSWNANADVRFSINLEDDFEGHSAYSVKLGYTMHGLDSLGGEWRNDFEIGRRQKIYTELFQPLDAMQRYYLRPALSYDKLIDLIPLGGGNQEVRVETYGGEIAFGAHITTDYQFEGGLRFNSEEDRADIVAVSTIINNYKARSFFASALVDNLDNFNFPSKGILAKAHLEHQLSSLGSDYTSTKLYMEVEKPFSYKDNSLVAFAKAGLQLDPLANNTPISDMFFLGGMFNLSGYKKYSFYDDNMMFGAIKYRYRIKDGGFLGSLAVPLYAGFTVESGTVWGSQTTTNALDNTVIAGSLYIAADTFLGPFYLTYGHSEAANQTVYLFLGEKF